MPNSYSAFVYDDVDYQMWMSGEPNNANGRETCVSVLTSRNYRWNDDYCGNSYCFVCENRNA